VMSLHSVTFWLGIGFQHFIVEWFFGY